ncbi:MAG: HAD family phosphatase [Chloroflexi bacterium]|nr:HAD family phosphatase [Chloroflexota bacterium]
MNKMVNIPNIGDITSESGFKLLQKNGNGEFLVGQHGVKAIAATGDGKVEFICFDKKAFAFVNSSMGYPAYYPIHPVDMKKPVRAVLMDLDGTTVRSEEFWIWIIEKTIATLLDNPNFQLEDADIPFVSGHSVSEHLTYCISKYCRTKTVEEARNFYFQHTHFEMNEIMKGRGKPKAFTPTEGIGEFLYQLKERDIKIGLVTSGLYEKAWPEILDAFKTLGMGDPKDFYDAIITAGFPLRKGSPGTLGELSPKPHPWLYAETARVGLGVDFSDRNSVVGIEDSGAGVCSIRLAGFPTIGIGGGNIIESGTHELCCHYCESFDEIASIIF